MNDRGAFVRREVLQQAYTCKEQEDKTRTRFRSSQIVSSCSLLRPTRRSNLYTYTHSQTLSKVTRTTHVGTYRQGPYGSLTAYQAAPPVENPALIYSTPLSKRSSGLRALYLGGMVIQATSRADVAACSLHSEAHLEAASPMHSEAASPVHLKAANSVHSVPMHSRLSHSTPASCKAAEPGSHSKGTASLHAEAAATLHAEAGSPLHSETACFMHSEAARFLHSIAARFLHSAHSGTACFLHSGAACFLLIVHLEAACFWHSGAACFLHSETHRVRSGAAW